MNIYKNRHEDIVIGICFILATIFYALGNNLIATAITTTNTKAQLIFGVLLELLNSLAVFTIGFFTYRRLRQSEPQVMNGYRITRWLEALILVIASISAALTHWFTVDSVNSFRQIMFAIAMLILGVYSVYFCYILLKKNLLPKWLMFIGIIGYASLAVYSSLLLLSKEASMMWFAPGAVFEILYPLYLMFKGFKQKVIPK